MCADSQWESCVMWPHRLAQDPVWHDLKWVWNAPVLAYMARLNPLIPQNTVCISLFHVNINCPRNTWIMELDLAWYIATVCSVSSQACHCISPLRYSRPVSECMAINKTLRRTQPHHAALHQQLWLDLHCMTMNGQYLKCSVAMWLTLYGPVATICTTRF